MKDWGQHNVLTYDEVLEEAQTGDIILFDNDVKGNRRALLQCNDPVCLQWAPASSPV